jgi:hypothetical protein
MISLTEKGRSFFNRLVQGVGDGLGGRMWPRVILALQVASGIAGGLVGSRVAIGIAGGLWGLQSTSGVVVLTCYKCPRL